MLIDLLFPFLKEGHLKKSLSKLCILHDSRIYDMEIIQSITNVPDILYMIQNHYDNT